MWKDKRVLVTGGTGFVGSHLVDELLAKGASVVVPVHRRPPPVRKPGIEFVQADLSRYEDCLRVSGGVSAVCHAAGAVGAASVGKAGMMNAIVVNLTLTAQMLQAGWAAGVEKFLIYGSSTGYPAFERPVKEEDMWAGPTHPSYFGYGWMRRYLERISEYVASQTRMQVAIVRPTAVYGPRDNFDPASCHVIPALVRRAVEKQNPYIVWGSGNEVRDFLHVRDLARGSIMLLEQHATCDPVNIGYGKEVTIRDTVYAILKAAGHENADVRFDSTKPTAIPYRAVDTTKAKRLLGFEPSLSLEDGLRDTVEWYVNSLKT